MSEELKQRTKRFALDVISACAGLPRALGTRHAIGQVIRSSSSVAANYRSACHGKSKPDFISKLGTVEEKADESGFWLEMVREIVELRHMKMSRCDQTRTVGIQTRTRCDQRRTQWIARARSRGTLHR